jgi:Flp pilus assembly protein TadD
MGAARGQGARDFLGQAMAAHQAGRMAEADALYRRAIEAEPGNAQALRLRGILARERGERDASLRYLRRACEVAPGDPQPLAELAVSRMAAGDLERAEADLREALALDPGRSRALANLGALLQYRGHITEAIVYHERALAQEPQDFELRCNLARALVDAGRGAEALALCDEALAAAPGHPLLLAARGAVLIDLGDYALAAAALEGAVLRYPDDDMAWVNLACARSRLGRHEAAIAALREALRANPDQGRATADLVNLLAGTGRGAEALALADGFLAQHPGERQVLAAQALALREAGREAEAAALLDFERLIRVSEPAPPQGFATIGEFNARLRELVEADSSLLPGPPSKATRGGFQTGELDLRRDPVLTAMGGVFEVAVRAADAALRADGLGGHPAMAYAAPAWSLRAWGTVLEAGGHQAPHIHPLGWLSAVYYVQVPSGMGESRHHAGWLEFGVPPDRFLVATPPLTRAVEPREGRLVVFPSYFYHRTLPFGSAGRRISLAADAIPR